MIKIENTEVIGWEHAIRGMRNPMNSWTGSDSGYCGGDNHIGCVHCHFAGDKEHNEKMIATDFTYDYGVLPCGKKEFTGEYEIGHKDYELRSLHWTISAVSIFCNLLRRNSNFIQL